MIQLAPRFTAVTRVPILMYHGVVSDNCEWSHWSQLPITRFVQQMKLLKSACCVMPLPEVIGALQDGTPLPRNAAAVTFDDGFHNNCTRAFPVLRELQIPATIFLVTGFMNGHKLLWPDELFGRLQLAGVAGHLQLPVDVDCELKWQSVEERETLFLLLLSRLKQFPNELRLKACAALAEQLPAIPGDSSLRHEFQAMTWDDARMMQSTGLIDFAPHTVTHPILSRLDDATLSDEIEQSCQEVAEQLGDAGPVFAYPNGQPEDYESRVVDCLKLCGITAGLTTVEGRATSSQNLFGLRRIPVGNNTSLTRFRMSCNGLMDRIRETGHRVRSGIRTLKSLTLRKVVARNSSGRSS